MPNTFHAKVGGVSPIFGVRYILLFLLDGAALLLLPFCLAVLNKRMRLGVFFTLLIFVYVFAVGGDVFTNGRFLLPVLPILVAGSLHGIYLAFSRSRILGCLVALSVAGFIPASLFCLSIEEINRGKSVAIADVLISKRIQARRLQMVRDKQVKQRVGLVSKIDPPVTLVAAIGIGRFGYFSKLPILDLVGLVDRQIAMSKKHAEGLRMPGHQRSDADYVFRRQPDVIFIPQKGKTDWILPAVQALWDDPRLDQLYFWNARIKAYMRKNRQREN